jgi:putative CocE/NonD family hydrolase
MTRRLASMLLVVTTFVTAGAVADRAEAQATSSSPAFTYQEVMLPVRDGVHLQTVLLTPTGAHGPLPILFTRTPYGVPDAAPATVPFALKDLAADGYIFVYQNLRGRFKSEGKFELTSQTNLEDSTAVSETTDAYDSVDWLTKHVPGTNGRVGMYGVSYPGLTAALALLKPHPALKAISEQAAPVDWWMNDDMHHFGALRESYAMEYAVLEQADKNKNTNFDFDVYDTYSWYLKAGPLSTINAKYLHGTIPFWNDIIAHPNYDAFWKKEATSPASGIRRIRGVPGRSFGMRPSTTPTTPA